jgi:hypothetical protein
MNLMTKNDEWPILFHATTKYYEAGQVLPDATPTAYYPQVVNRLERDRPCGAPSRSMCYFASESPTFAVEYKRTQLRFEAENQRATDLRAGITQPESPLRQVKLYEVEIPDGRRSPVVLIDSIRKGLAKGLDVSALVIEYWRTVREWKFYEVFGPSMRIRGIVPLPSDAECYAAYISYTLGETDHADAMLAQCKPLSSQG